MIVLTLENGRRDLASPLVAVFTLFHIATFILLLIVTLENEPSIVNNLIVGSAIVCTFLVTLPLVGLSCLIIRTRSVFGKWAGVSGGIVILSEIVGLAGMSISSHFL